MIQKAFLKNILLNQNNDWIFKYACRNPWIEKCDLLEHICAHFIHIMFEEKRSINVIEIFHQYIGKSILIFREINYRYW